MIILWLFYDYFVVTIWLITGMDGLFHGQSQSKMDDNWGYNHSGKPPFEGDEDGWNILSRAHVVSCHISWMFNYWKPFSAVHQSNAAMDVPELSSMYSSNTFPISNINRCMMCIHIYMCIYTYIFLLSMSYICMYHCMYKHMYVYPATVNAGDAQVALAISPESWCKWSSTKSACCLARSLRNFFRLSSTVWLLPWHVPLSESIFFNDLVEICYPKSDLI